MFLTALDVTRTDRNKIFLRNRLVNGSYELIKSYRARSNQYTPYRHEIPRISLAKQYYEETETDDETGSWLVLYDFIGIKPSSKFWTNLKRIQAIVGAGTLIQYSVFTTDSKRGAITAVKLAKHYGAQVKLFKAEEVNLS